MGNNKVCLGSQLCLSILENRQWQDFWCFRDFELVFIVILVLVSFPQQVHLKNYFFEAAIINTGIISFQLPGLFPLHLPERAIHASFVLSKELILFDFFVGRYQ